MLKSNLNTSTEMIADISYLINLRFLIIKIVKDSKTKMTLEDISSSVFELTKKAPSIETFSDAVCELGRHEILNIEFNEGGSLYSRRHVGHDILSVSF